MPDELIEEVDEIVKQKKYGFRSRPELIKHAIRQLLLQIKNDIYSISNTSKKKYHNAILFGAYFGVYCSFSGPFLPSYSLALRPGLHNS
ncbi:MAG: hypothetical protein IH934_05675 [Nanoarchaeota archaeon]|nr:hypothetical protein [Nanoarchaeota archaeon]